MTDQKRSGTGDPARRVGRGRESGTGAFAGTQHGGGNNGVSSAKPEAITGHDDATFKTDADKAAPKGNGGEN